MGLPSARGQGAADGVASSEAECSEDAELVALGLSAGTVAAVLRVVGARRAARRRRVTELASMNRALEARVDELTREMRERDEEYQRDLHMCQVVKKMDEQRVALLEEHNRELQRKIQALTG